MAEKAAKRSSTLARLCALAAPIALCACMDTTAEIAPDPDAPHQIVARQGANVAAASLAIVSVEGAPPGVAASFVDQLKRDAQARDITLADPAMAHYLVRGYLSASLDEDGASIEYVWDVFTADKRRAQRITDAVVVKGEGDDPWALAGAGALSSVAAKSADDLAAYLSYTPEATPVAAGAPASAVALSYAPQ
jgi:hypothetical protein